MLLLPILLFVTKEKGHTNFDFGHTFPVCVYMSVNHLSKHLLSAHVLHTVLGNGGYESKETQPLLSGSL